MMKYLFYYFGVGFITILFYIGKSIRFVICRLRINIP